jgi:hypothetical protein
VWLETSALPDNLRLYLELFLEVVFELPVRQDDGSLWDHGEVSTRPQRRRKARKGDGPCRWQPFAQVDGNLIPLLESRSVWDPRPLSRAVERNPYCCGVYRPTQAAVSDPDLRLWSSAPLPRVDRLVLGHGRWCVTCQRTRYTTVRRWGPAPRASTAACGGRPPPCHSRCEPVTPRHPPRFFERRPGMDRPALPGLQRAAATRSGVVRWVDSGVHSRGFTSAFWRRRAVASPAGGRG